MSSALFDLCDNRADRAVEAVVSLWRALWTSAKREPNPTFEITVLVLQSPTLLGYLRDELKQRCWLEHEEQRSERLSTVLLELLKQEPGKLFVRVPREHFCLFSLVRATLGKTVDSCDLEYWAGRDLRNKTRMVLSAPIVRAVQIYTKSVRAWLETLEDEPWAHYGMFLIATKTTSEGLTPDDYFDLIAAMGWIWPASSSGEVEANPAFFDAEKLIGRYFGLPTAIPGLDAIFAGSGLLIVDAPGTAACQAATEFAQPIGGRAIVITGPYGSGKSTLALELAIEVARKGGAAIVAAMEQSPEECLYSMESLGISTHSERFDTVREMREAIPLFTQPYNGKGVLAFLPIRRPVLQQMEESSQFDEFLRLLEERFTWMQGYPLRLIIVDPMNSILARGEELERGRRLRVLQLFEQAKQRGINLCLTRERGGTWIKILRSKKILPTRCCM